MKGKKVPSLTQIKERYAQLEANYGGQAVAKAESRLSTDRMRRLGAIMAGYGTLKNIASAEGCSASSVKRVAWTALCELKQNAPVEKWILQSSEDKEASRLPDDTPIERLDLLWLKHILGPTIKTIGQVTPPPLMIYHWSLTSTRKKDTMMVVRAMIVKAGREEFEQYYLESVGDDSVI